MNRKVYLVAAVTLSAIFCTNLFLSADLTTSSQNSSSNPFFYSLEDPIDDSFKVKSLQSAVSNFDDEDLGLLTEGDAWHENEIALPVNPIPKTPATLNQPDAGQLSTPVTPTPLSPPGAPAPTPQITPPTMPSLLTPQNASSQNLDVQQIQDVNPAQAAPANNPQAVIQQIKTQNIQEALQKVQAEKASQNIQPANTNVAPQQPSSTPDQFQPALQSPQQGLQSPIFQPQVAPTQPTTVAPTQPAVAPTQTIPSTNTPANTTPGISTQTPNINGNASDLLQPGATQGNGQVLSREEDLNKKILINFNNVAVTEYIRFISRVTNKNFVFDENDLQFTVTIVSEEPTSIDNIMTALLQELRIHDLDLIEQGNTIIIHRNNKVTAMSKVVTENSKGEDIARSDIITRVFRLNTLEADKAAVILKPMVSSSALVEVLKDTNHLIITDLSANIREISVLLNSLDSPQSGLVIGQYVVKTQPLESLIAITQRIVAPIAHDQKVTFIPHRFANSIFVVANPYLVERTLAILKYLDQSGTATQILNPRDLNYTPASQGHWVLDKNGNWQFIPGDAIKGANPPRGNWRVDDQGNWYFEPGEPEGGQGPDGKWILDKDGNWIFQLNAGKSIAPIKTQRKEKFSSELPVGHIERTQFSIYKLQYRKGEQIARALSRIAESLSVSGAGTNTDLLAAILSVQWIESSNSLIFTGTPDAIEKMKQLIHDIDVPLRQVLLEMLILETDITDSLNFSTNVASNFGGGNTSGAEAFLSGASTLPGGMATSGVGLLPNAAPQATNLTGFVLGIIGQTITHNGTEYATLGALVKALTTRSCTKIVMNPKVLTEDNSPAEVFVGLNTQFPTQSIANNLGTIVTQNFEFRDVGTTLKVTPSIGNNDVVTLEIQEEVSTIVSGGVQSGTLTNQVIGPTTKINRTTTKVHVPNGFFLILSGMLSDQIEKNRTQVPCLGSIPIIGAAFSDKQDTDTRQNVMIFVHPIIIDTEEEIDNITRREQNIFRVKNRTPKTWVWETDEAMDFFNIIDTDNRDGTGDDY